jgi:hypothetical protein
MEERNGPLMAGTGLEKKGPKPFFLQLRNCRARFSLLNILLLNGEERRKEVFEDSRSLCSKKSILRATPLCLQEVSGEDPELFPLSFFWLEKEKKGINGTWGRHSDGRALGGAESAGCVRRLDGSLVPAIRITYRVSLRSSSSREPRYPSTGVVSGFLVSCFFVSQKTKTKGSKVFNAFSLSVFFFLALFFFQILLREREKRRSTVRG